MSRYMMQIMVACLAVCCIILFAQNWQLQQQLNQLQEQLNQQHNEQKQFQVAISGELHVINKREKRHYDILYEMVQKSKENTKNILSLFADLTKNVKVIKKKLEIDVARLDEKVDSNDKRMTEEIGENQQKLNNSMCGLAELFVNEMTKFENRAAKFENETREKHEQLEAMARQPIMIENKVHVDTECHHHHHQVVPQLSLGEQIRQIVGGVLQSGTTYLWSKAMEIIGM